MKTFDEIYYELLNENNSELHTAWRKVKKDSDKAKKVALIICLIIDIFLISVFINIGVGFMGFLGIIWIVISNIVIYAIATTIVRANKNGINFTNLYKSKVIGKIIANFYNNAEYYQNKQMPEYIYKPLNYEYYNMYKSDDYFEAVIDNKHSLQMAEILTQEKRTHTNSKGQTETEIITKFHGLFAKIEMDKSINSELKIMQNGQFVFDKKRLKMDSSEFEKYFDVKASNQIIGMQLLTADIMEELIQFQQETKMKYDIYINNNIMYLRFHSGTMFEPVDIKYGALNEKEIHKYFYMLNFTYNLSKKMIKTIEETHI